jgi:hypothetical protein
LEDLQVEASLQLSIYSYATSMNGLADQEDLRLCFDVLTKTKQPELHCYWTTRDRAANRRLFRLVAEVLHAIEAGSSIRIPAGPARTARSGAAAWRGGERSSGRSTLNRRPLAYAEAYTRTGPVCVAPRGPLG